MVGEDDLPPEEAGEDDDPVIPNAADPISFRKTVDKQRRIKDKVKDFWINALSTDVGRSEAWSLISEFFLSQPFAVGPNGFPQPDATWFQAGQREKAFVLYHKLLAINRDGVMRMLDEHHPQFAKPKRSRRKTEDNA